MHSVARECCVYVDTYSNICEVVVNSKKHMAASRSLLLVAEWFGQESQPSPTGRSTSFSGCTQRHIFPGAQYSKLLDASMCSLIASLTGESHALPWLPKSRRQESACLGAYSHSWDKIVPAVVAGPCASPWHPELGKLGKQQKVLLPGLRQNHPSRGIKDFPCVSGLAVAAWLRSPLWLSTLGTEGFVLGAYWSSWSEIVPVTSAGAWLLPSLDVTSCGVPRVWKSPGTPLAVLQTNANYCKLLGQQNTIQKNKGSYSMKRSRAAIQCSPQFDQGCRACPIYAAWPPTNLFLPPPPTLFHSSWSLPFFHFAFWKLLMLFKKLFYILYIFYLILLAALSVCSGKGEVG